MNVYGPILPEEAFPDWTREFGRAAPLHLEIGFGKGGFLVDFAAMHPEVNFVGIEIARELCEYVKDRVRRHHLAHVAVYQGDAKLLAPRLFAPESLAAVHILFPDPWWKRKHHKRRMVDEDLALLLRRLLMPGGLLDFRSDVEAYARAALAAFEEDAGLVNTAGPGHFRPDTPDVLSTRERRYAQTGTPVWRLHFRKDPKIEPRPQGIPRADWLDTRRK